MALLALPSACESAGCPQSAGCPAPQIKWQRLHSYGGKKREAPFGMVSCFCCFIPLIPGQGQLLSRTSSCVACASLRNSTFSSSGAIDQPWSSPVLIETPATSLLAQTRIACYFSGKVSGSIKTKRKGLRLEPFVKINVCKAALAVKSRKRAI